MELGYGHIVDHWVVTEEAHDHNTYFEESE
jgi:hypothetical protein